MSAESANFDPYESVLADLRAKREQIDSAIAAIEAIRGGTASAPSMSAGGGPNIAIDAPGAFLGMSIPEAAKKLLASKRQPLRNPEIVAGFRAGGFVLGSKDPVNTVGAVLSRRATDVGDIVKVGRGTWGLKEWFPGRSFKKPEKAENGDKGEPTIGKVEGGPASSHPSSAVRKRGTII